MNKSVKESISEFELTGCELVTMGNSENNYQKQHGAFSGEYLAEVTDQEENSWKSFEYVNTMSDEKLDAMATKTTTQFIHSVSKRSSNPFLIRNHPMDTNPFRCAANSNPFKEVSVNSFSSTSNDGNEVYLPRVSMEKCLFSTNPFKNCVENELNYEYKNNGCNLQIETDIEKAGADVRENRGIDQINELCVGIETDNRCLIKKVTVKTTSLRKSKSTIYDNVNALIGGDEIVKIENCYLNQLTYTQCENLLKSMSYTTDITIKRQNFTSNANEQAEFSVMDVSSFPFTKLIITKENGDYNPQVTTTLEDTFLLDNALLFQRGDAHEGDVPKGFKKLSVVIQKNEDEHLGVSIVPSYGVTRELYQIKRLLPEGVCAKSGHIEIGDRLLTCNGIYLKNLTQTHCLDILRHSKSPLELTVLRQEENKNQNVHLEKDYSNDSLISPHKESEKASEAKHFDISITNKSLSPSDSTITIKDVSFECNTASTPQNSLTVFIEKSSVTTSDKILKEKYDNQKHDDGSEASLNFIDNDHRIIKGILIKGLEDFPYSCYNCDAEGKQEVNDCVFLKNVSEQLADSFLSTEKEIIPEKTLPSLNSSVKNGTDSIINSPSINECLKSGDFIETYNLFEISDSLSYCAFNNVEKKLNDIISQYTKPPLMLDQESTGKLLAPVVNPYSSRNLLKMDFFPSSPVSIEEKAILSMKDEKASIIPFECNNKYKESISTHDIVEGNILSEIKDLSIPAQNVQPATSTQALNLYQYEEKELSSNSLNTNESFGEEAKYYTTFGVNTMGQDEDIPICPMTSIKDSNGNSLCIPSTIIERNCFEQSRVIDQDAKENIATMLAGFSGLKPQIKQQTSNVPHRVVFEDEIVPTILNQNQKEIVTDILKKWQKNDSHKCMIERAVSGFIKPTAHTPFRNDYDNLYPYDKAIAEASLPKTQINEAAAFQDSLKSGVLIKEEVSEVIDEKRNGDIPNVQLRLKCKKDVKNANKNIDTEETTETLKNRDDTGQDYKTMATSGFQPLLENFGKTFDPISLKLTPRRPKNMIEDSRPQSSAPLTSITTEDVALPAFKLQRSSIAKVLPNGRPSSDNFIGISFTSKIKTEYPKTRQEDGKLFQVDVLKGITGLGIKVTVNSSGYAQVSDIQRGGPIDKNGQIRVNDYLWSINSTELKGQNDAKVQQVLRLLPRGLVKIVVSSTKSTEMEENINELREQKESLLSVSTKPPIFPSSTYSSLQKLQTEKQSLDLAMAVKTEMPLSYSITETIITENINDSSSGVLPKDSSLSSVNIVDLSTLADKIPKEITSLDSHKEQSAPQKVCPLKEDARDSHSDDAFDEFDNGNVSIANKNTDINVDIFSDLSSMSEAISNNKEEYFQLKLSPDLTTKQASQLIESDVLNFKGTSVAPGASQLSFITKEARITPLKPKIPPPVAPKPQSGFRMTAKSDYSGDLKFGEQLLNKSHLTTSKNDSPKLFNQSVQVENVKSSKTMVASQVRKFDKPCFTESNKSTPSRPIESSKVEITTSKNLPITPSVVSTNYISPVTSAIRPKDIDTFYINRESSDSKTIRVLSPSRLNNALSPRISAGSPTSPPTQKFAVSKNTRPHYQSFIFQDLVANQVSSDSVTKVSFDNDIDTFSQNTQKSIEVTNEQNKILLATHDTINFKVEECSEEKYGQFSENFKKEEKDISDSFSTTPMSPINTTVSENKKGNIPNPTLRNKKPVALPRKKVENQPSPDHIVDNGVIQFNHTDDLLIHASPFSQISDNDPLLESGNHSIKDITGLSDLNKSYSDDLQEELITNESSEQAMKTFNNENLSNLLLVTEKETNEPLGSETEGDILIRQAKQIVEQVITNVFSDKYTLRNTVNDLDIYHGFSENEPPPLPEAPPPYIKNSVQHVLLEKLNPNLDNNLESLSEFPNDQNINILKSGEHDDELVIIVESLTTTEQKDNFVDNGAGLLDIQNETLHPPIEHTCLKEIVENINLSSSIENDNLKNKNDASCKEHEMIVNTINEEFDAVPYAASTCKQMIPNIHGEIQNVEDIEQWIPPHPTTAPPVFIEKNDGNDNTVICHETSLAATDVNVLQSFNLFYNDEHFVKAEEILNCSPVANKQSCACDSTSRKSVESCDKESPYKKQEMEDCRNENVEEPIENVSIHEKEQLTSKLKITNHKIQDDIKHVADAKDILLKNSSSAKKNLNTEHFIEDPEETYVHPAAQPETEIEEQFDSNQKTPRKEEILKVVMVKGATGVGLCLEGGKGSPKGNLPITIKRIFKGGPAEKCGKLKVKDEILEVNGVDFTSMRHYEAWNHLKFLDDGDINITIRRH